MKIIDETYEYKGVIYNVEIEKKLIKNTYYRFKNNTFYITTSLFCKTENILKSLDKFAPKLIKTKLIDLENYFIYLFNNKIESQSNIYQIFNKNYLIINEDDFYKKIKKEFLNYLTNRTRYFEGLMGVKPSYKISLKKMKTRLGSNSRKTHTINYSIYLIHKSFEAIDSVIIHELAHHFEFNHSKKFYDIVYKYCPNYNKIKKEFKTW